MTVTQYRVLSKLMESPQYPGDLYPVVSPRGRYLVREPNNTHGGPSRRECCVNWYLGKMARTGWVKKYSSLDMVTRGEWRGKWVITEEGRRVMGKTVDLKQ